MTADNLFRVSLFTTLGLLMTVVAYHRLQAAKSGEPISRKDEGLWIGLPLRLAGLGMWIGTFVFLIHPAGMQWSAMPFPDWLRWTGIGFGVLAIALMYWTLTNLGKNLTDTVVTRVQATFVSTGPYRWVRHPFYVTILLVMVSVTLTTANWFIGLCGAIVMAMLVIRTPIEEQKLIDKFGEEYRTYMGRTSRFLPVRFG